MRNFNVREIYAKNENGETTASLPLVMMNAEADVSHMALKKAVPKGKRLDEEKSPRSPECTNTRHSPGHNALFVKRDALSSWLGQ